MKPTILVIVGQTATGKSSFAVDIAKKMNGEIVSADSRQVYKGLDIGSGKITKKEMKGVPHYLLDVASPTRRFTVADYSVLGQKAIETILEKGKLPLIVGGTGFYIESLVDGIVHPEVSPNNPLRKKLEILSVEKLFATLKKLDPTRAKTIDAQNKVRLIRAIEIAKALGKVPKIKKIEKYNPIFIGLKLSDEQLKKNINKRLLSRIKDGMIEEVENLHNGGLSWKRMEELGLEYRFISLYLQKKMTLEEMIVQLERAIWQYAKRQDTWFKRDKRIKWISIG